MTLTERLNKLSDGELIEVEWEISKNVCKWDGIDDDMYGVWKTLLELIWMEKKRRNT